MAGARKCDACGNLYEAYNFAENPQKPSGINLLNVDSDGRFYRHKVIDLCPECMNRVMDILNQKRRKSDE